MLQRIQTLFLLGVALCMTATALLPVWHYTTTNDTFHLAMGELVHSSQEIENSINMIYLLAIAITAGAIAFITIFKFKNRRFQMKLSLLNSLLIIIYMVLTFVFVPFQAEKLLGSEILGIHLCPPFYLTVLALIFNILARVFIKKDEDLIRSVDRIR